MNLKDIDSLDLVDRYNSLLKTYVSMAPELAKQLEKFGKIRNELQILLVEFGERNIKIQDSEELNKLFEEQIKDMDKDGKENNNNE